MIAKPKRIDFVDPVPGVGSKTVEVGKNHGVSNAVIDFETRTVAVTIDAGPRKGVKIVPFQRVAAFELDDLEIGDIDVDDNDAIAYSHHDDAEAPNGLVVVEGCDAQTAADVGTS